MGRWWWWRKRGDALCGTVACARGEGERRSAVRRKRGGRGVAGGAPNARNAERSEKKPNGCEPTLGRKRAP